MHSHIKQSPVLFWNISGSGLLYSWPVFTKCSRLSSSITHRLWAARRADKEHCSAGRMASVCCKKRSREYRWILSVFVHWGETDEEETLSYYITDCTAWCRSESNRRWWSSLLSTHLVLCRVSKRHFLHLLFAYVASTSNRAFIWTSRRF